MNYKLIKHKQVDRKTVIEWYYSALYNHYRVEVRVYNREVYTKVLDRRHYEIYHNFINERISYLFKEDILNKDYVMILLDGVMYKVIDSFHHMDLMRFLVPVDGIQSDNLEDYLKDLVLDTTIRTGEVFSDTDLVFHNGAFYNNGVRIKDIRDFNRDGIEYNYWDLMNGITKEQLEYLVSDYYSKDFEKYITREVKLNIDRWY